jgi:hypothetical protein
MNDTKIEPDKIKTPIQLLVIWLVGLIVLVSAFLTASTATHKPEWLNSMFGITSVVLIPLFILLIFILQTKFRPELLDDEKYIEHKKLFTTFKPENISTVNKIEPLNIEVFENLDKERKQIYEYNKGIFLVHEWRPSTIKGQKADIILFIAEHPKQKLTVGKIKSVEYELGRKFFNTTIIKTNESENFRLDVSAYAGMLCIAKVTFTNNETITLTRYINFDEE